MTQYEYKIVPAPRKGRKAKGVKGNEARFAYAIEGLMNEYAADGWEFLRAEVLPSDERQGLTSVQTVYRDLLVFRRPRAYDEAALNQAPLEQDATPTAAPAPAKEEDVWQSDARDDTDTAASEPLNGEDQSEDSAPARAQAVP